MKLREMLTQALLALIVFVSLITSSQAATPVANAGPDITIADYDGNNSVTVSLNGSASTDADGDIVSYTWSWAGGSASGITPEAVFPATNLPVTVTLTVIDATSGTSTDTLSLIAFTKQVGLFTDFKKPAYAGISTAFSPYDSRVVASLREDTLVIDPKGPGIPEVYRFSAGNWIPSPFAASVADIRAIDANTLLSGNIASGNGFTAHRFVSGNWVATTQSVSIIPPGRRIQDNAYETGAVASSNSFDDTYFNNAGRAFVYDWIGNTWTHSELLPPEGFIAGKRWGEGIDTDGTTTAVTEGSGSGSGTSLKIFKKSGSWTHQVSLTPPVEPGGFPQSYYSGIVAVGNGIVVAQREFPYALFVIEFNGSTWVQTKLPITPLIPSGGYFGLEMDDDGQSFVAYDQSGRFILYQKDAISPNWASATVTQRRLPISEMFGGNQLLCTEFSGGKMVLSDSVNGVVRIFDKNAPFDTANAEPIANAGDDVFTASLDGQPVELFLDGSLSSDASANETLSAVWSWSGGSATGLETFAMIPVSVTTITLTITDSKGAISRDSFNTNIISPPVINPGSNIAIADSDANGLVRVRVNPTIVSQSHPIVSWEWSWLGGSFSGQSGVLNLGPEADGKPITLRVIDSAGLASSSSFTFDLLKPNPTPDIIVPANGVSLDRYGWAVGIHQGVALTGAPFKTGNGTYFAKNVNNRWNQYSIASSDKRGQAVLIDGEFAFVGAGFQATGSVVVYKNVGGSWVVFQTLSPGDPEGSGFGHSIARSGNTLVIGAPRTGVFGATTGAFYVFELSAGTWSQVQKIVTPDPPTFFGDDFGARVAIHGNFLAVSQPGFASNSAVFVYEKIASSWTFRYKFQADIPRPPQGRSPNTEGFYFGIGLAMNQDELLIGSRQDGLVYRYTRSGSDWTRNGSILKSGNSLALQGGVLAIGSYPDDSGRSFLDADYIPGTVFIFSLVGGNWQQVGSVWPNGTLDPNIIEDPEYGHSVAHDGKDLIVGLPRARNSSGVQTGKAYIYRNYAPLNPNANYEPLANAGADINVTDTIVRGPAPAYLITEPLGSQLVTLNGGGSTDQENAIVSYEWTWPGGSSSGVSPNARFPVGTTIVTLTVTDALGVVNSDNLSVTISLPQPLPVALADTSANTLALDLPSPDAKWRLSSEFLWHGYNESATGIVNGATYQVEIIAFPGSTDIITTFIEAMGSNTSQVVELELPSPATATSSISFPETSQGFAWRLSGEATWRDVTDDGDTFFEDITFTLPVGDLRIEYKPVAGFTTPPPRNITVTEGESLALDWAEYLRINSFDPSKTFEITTNTTAAPYQYVGMIRSPLGRGTGTVVAERVVLTAAHLFFDPNGLQWADTQWFSRQKQGERQAPPITPRGVLYQTSYAKLIAPDSVEGTVADLPEDPQQVDFAVLYFSAETTWDQGSANFLQSTPDKNWLTGGENKHAIGYPQRSQQFENRGKIFTKQFASPLVSLGTGLYETTAVFGDGGASGSALFVQPAGGGTFYPAAILLAGQGRAVYRVIDEPITRMIKDGEDAATGNDDVLNGDSSQLTFDGLGALTTIGVQVFPSSIRSRSRWTITPAKGASSANMQHTKQVGFDEKWTNFTINFTAISGYKTPPPLKVFNGAVDRGELNNYSFTYVVIPPPTTPSPLETWKNLHNITSLSSDGDHDGMSALLEYALDRNPGTSDFRAAIRNSAAPSQSVFAEFDVYVSSTAAGIVYTVKASNTLDQSSATALATFTHADGSSAYRKVTDTQPISSSTRRFVWLEAIAP